MPGGKGSSIKINIKERQAAALSLRKKGGSYRAIALTIKESGKFGNTYNQKTAHGDVMAALKELNDKCQEDIASIRTLEIERIDELLQGIYVKAKNGDVFAIDRVLRLMERRSRYLDLDAPQKIAIQDMDSMIEKELARLAASEAIAAETTDLIM